MAMSNFFIPRASQPQGMTQKAALHFGISSRHDVVQNGHAFKERNVLKRPCNPLTRSLSWIHTTAFFTSKMNVAYLRVIHAVYDVNHRTFTRPVRTNNGANFVLTHIE